MKINTRKVISHTINTVLIKSNTLNMLIPPDPTLSGAPFHPLDVVLILLRGK